MSVSSEAMVPVLLSLTERAVEVRRSLEPTAWMVLEELALTVPGSLERPVGVRSIAGALGRSPDAVARALRLLIEAGVVTRTAERDEWSGRFGASTYTVDLDRAGLQIPPSSPSLETPCPPPKQPKQHAHQSSSDERLF